MKNIYDLLNQAEDNEDILSENERMEMSDIEKRRIYNRILLDSEEEQEEQSCDEQKKYQDNEKAQQVEGGRNIESEEGQKTADSGGLHGGDLCRWLYSGGSSKGISV